MFTPNRPQFESSLARLCRARDLIRDCFTEPVTLGDCAAEARLSPWHLLRAFRATFGETPKEFLTRLRLEHARHLLTVTDRPVTVADFLATVFTAVGVDPAAENRTWDGRPIPLVKGGTVVEELVG